MTHPEELLAGYVDGTLRDDERAVVDAHLEGCDLCREEVELARGAVAALATLEELPVPLGVTGPVLSEARRAPDRTRGVRWQRLQWAAGAAAAALVLVVAVNLSLGGPDDDGPASTAGGDAALEAPAESAEGGAARDVGLEVQDANYREEGIRSLAEQIAAEEEERSAQDASPPAVETELAAPASSPRAALDCLRTGEAPVDDPAHELTRLIQAEYQGTPAYIAVFLKSPGAGQPADRVVVWVVASDDCRLLTGVQV